jgi:hypothetical protein
MAKETSTIQTRLVTYLILVLFSLVIADGLMSQFLISYGLGYESNPFLANMILTTDFLVIKVGGAFLSAILLWFVNKRRPQLALFTSVILVAIYTAILFWNIFVYFSS